jgi:hypothetical protein
MIRFLLYIFIGVLFYRIVRTLFLKPKQESHVKGESHDKDNLQDKHKRNIEDADFEEIE